MTKLALICLGSMLMTVPENSQIVVKEPLIIRQTYYQIDAKLDTVKKSIDGRMETFWVNKSSIVVTEVWMHLYMNAFRSNKTTFNKESGETTEMKESDRGWINVKNISDSNGKDLLHDL
jgi:hypothetical protein